MPFLVKHLKSLHLPFAYKYRGASDACWLVQDGFVTLYSPSKATPIFTSERLERSTLIKVFYIHKNIGIHVHVCIVIVYNNLSVA